MARDKMQIGIDWGGTKIEIIALDAAGETLARTRVATPKGDYEACISVVRDLVLRIERETGRDGSVGIGIPGTISPATGLVKNANSTWLNGQPLKEDTKTALDREVLIANDANCFAVSEAVDGAGAGHEIVVGVIIGTGCGAGIAINGKALMGAQGIAGEFGHTPLPRMTDGEHPGNACWCGRRGCLETYISGTGFERTYESLTGAPSPLSAADILALDDAASRETYRFYCDQLARGIAQLINMIDPHIIVLGGGMSNVASLYKDVPPLLAAHVFSDTLTTQIKPAKYGDSSGVRGAARLWA